MNLEIAAFHECGHAVAAMASRFHSAPLALTATTSGHGDAYFGPSARKLRDAGKPADQSCVSDPEVAREAALICFAGLAAEKRRCQEMQARRRLTRLHLGPTTRWLATFSQMQASRSKRNRSCEPQRKP